MSLLSLLGRCGAGPAGRVVLAAACAVVSLTVLGQRPAMADIQDGVTVGAVGAVGAAEAVDVVGAVDVLDAVEAAGAEEAEAALGDDGAMVAQAAPHVPPLPDAGEATAHGVPPLPAEQRVVSAGGLRPFPAAAAPFDATGRRGLAMDALTFLVTHQGLLPGRGVYLLPRPNWLGSALFRAPRDAWDLSIPGGVPIYLLAQADPSGAIDPAATTVTVNGVPLPDLGAYIQTGIPALADLGPNDYAMPDVGVRDHAVLDIVF
ncbi:MAG TPA: hypothetical protein VHN78_15940, partial [Chloroflexota bacterium]|nr:hypothetical protein [Chloroflexota bacterium]